MGVSARACPRPGPRPWPSRRRPDGRHGRRRTRGEVGVDPLGDLDLLGKEVEAARPPTRHPSRRRCGRRACSRTRSASRVDAPRPAPRPRTCGPGKGTTSWRPGERAESLGAEQSGAEQHVLVGEGQQRPAVLVGHDATSVAPRTASCGRPGPGRPARKACRRCARACKRSSPEACCPSRAWVIEDPRLTFLWRDSRCRSQAAAPHRDPPFRRAQRR